MGIAGLVWGGDRGNNAVLTRKDTAAAIAETKKALKPILMLCCRWYQSALAVAMQVRVGGRLGPKRRHTGQGLLCILLEIRRQTDEQVTTRKEYESQAWHGTVVWVGLGRFGC